VSELSRPFWIPLSFQIWEYPEYCRPKVGIEKIVGSVLSI